MKALNCKEKDPSFYHKIYINCNDNLNKKLYPLLISNNIVHGKDFNETMP